MNFPCSICKQHHHVSMYCTIPLCCCFQVQQAAVQQELEDVQNKAASLAATAEELAQLKERFAAARAAAAAAKQAAQKEAFQLQSQVNHA